MNASRVNFCSFGLLAASPLSRAGDLDPSQITTALKRSADWQLANPSGTEIRDWIIAPLYDGLLRTTLATGDPKYLAAVVRMGTQAGWTASNRVYHADDHAVGHAWLDVYLMDRTREERLAPMRDRLSHVIANPVTEKLEFGSKPKTKGVGITDRWTWCDALYTVSYSITGTPDDPVYVLATYSSLTGTAFASVPAPPTGYTLDYSYQGDKIALLSVSASPHEIWAGGASFGDDENGAGVPTAWLLLGAANPDEIAQDLLPTAAEGDGGLALTFNENSPIWGMDRHA